MSAWIASLRTMLATMLVCVGAYAAVVYGIAHAFVPDKAEGSLLRTADGTIVGSSLIAQGFTSPRYFWPRPSAVAYDASAAGGSNKSPTSHDLTERAEKIVAAYGATSANPLPPELAAASGSGLDPDLSEEAALYQAPRVAAARGLEAAAVEGLIHRQSFAPGSPLVDDRIVDVLELNLALDALDASGAGRL
jgi:K+-transporting ATPase ATPase C chain